MGNLPHPVLLSTFLGLDEITIAGMTMEFKHVFYTWVVMAALFIFSAIARKNLTLVPGKIQNVCETLVDGLEQLVINTMGEEGRKYVGLLVAIFIFLFTLNVCGLLPLFDAPTANFNTTLAFAAFVFLYYNFQGLKRWKAGYIKHFMGPSPYMVPLIFPIEIVSHVVRLISLSLRLLGNIRGEEIVLVIFFLLFPVISTVPVYFLFLLAKTLQAFIFFMLTMMYIKGAVDHAH